MKNKIFKTRILLFLTVVLLSGLGTSCKDDSTSSSSGVELLSFGPTGSQIGDTISFIGQNLDQVIKIKFAGDSVLKPSFLTQSYGLIKVIVPSYTTKGFVTLYTANDTIVSKTQFDLLVPVTITGIPQKVRPGETITITGQFMNWITEVWFAKDIVVRDSDFISKSLTKIVLTVPMQAQSGSLVFNTGGTKPLTLTSEKDVIVTLPSITSIAPIPVERGGNLTITGTDLDLTKGILFKGVTDTVKNFVSKSATQLVVKVPLNTVKGPLTLVAYSNVPIVSKDKVQLVGDVVDLAPLAYAFYEDVVLNGWSDWGWGRDADYANTDFVRDGNFSMKVTYTGTWSGVAFQNGSVMTSGYTEVAFAVYGTPGTGGKSIFVKLNWNDPGVHCPIIEGEWTEYKVPLSSLFITDKITVLMISSEDWTGTVYLDHIGLR